MKIFVLMFETPHEGDTYHGVFRSLQGVRGYIAEHEDETMFEHTVDGQTYFTQNEVFSYDDESYAVIEEVAFREDRVTNVLVKIEDGVKMAYLRAVNRNAFPWEFTVVKQAPAGEAQSEHNRNCDFESEAERYFDIVTR